MTSDRGKAHVDDKKGLARQFPATFPLALFSPKGTWTVDTPAEQAPWRVSVKPDEAITFSRLAVHRAWQGATTAIGQKRGEFEARAVLQKGYLDERGDVIRVLRLAAAKPKQPLSTPEMAAWLWTESLAARLALKSLPAIAEDGTCPKLAPWLEGRDSGDSSGPGRPSTFDLNAFFQLLVQFWDRNMSIRAPSSRRANPRMRKTQVGFHEFATAAAYDAGLTNFTFQRAISRTVVAVRRREKLAC